MFNATSLRETNNGMALNRSVYVLTAFTILYTPIGFMAVRVVYQLSCWLAIAGGILTLLSRHFGLFHF